MATRNGRKKRPYKLSPEGRAALQANANKLIAEGRLGPVASRGKPRKPKPRPTAAPAALFLNAVELSAQKRMDLADSDLLRRGMVMLDDGGLDHQRLVANAEAMLTDGRRLGHVPWGCMVDVRDGRILRLIWSTRESYVARADYADDDNARMVKFGNTVKAGDLRFWSAGELLELIYLLEAHHSEPRPEAAEEAYAIVKKAARELSDRVARELDRRGEVAVDG